MLVYSIVLFVLAAVVGIYLASRVLAGQLPPWPAAILHGLFAASGLALLLYTAFLTGGAPAQPVLIGAILLVVAALGGFVMVSFHAQKKPPPKALAIIHALAAVTGVGAVAASAFGLV
ncbi:MAG TPA: hypothetical protein VEA80_16000 [Vitreimonas sp.]|uniref:hypothetical protein n=1 Tax=Vitreimonas sp. TaxID=3069702 RepID=UPI002D54488B|nr:hypothetical protein [Vitreimonas sp.]HYD88979.1 hypothetical protein [Vitreimonas sp.]